MLSHGDHVVCAVTRQPIPLAELKYWSVERQEAYATAEASLEAEGKALIGGGEERTLFARASEAWHQGRHEAATQLLQTLIEAQPQHVAALNTLAMIALNRGDADRRDPLSRARGGGRARRGADLVQPLPGASTWPATSSAAWRASIARWPSIPITSPPS